MFGSAVVDLHEATGLEALASPVFLLVTGALLLVFGRRIYWLAVAAVGFGLGVYLAQRFLELEETAVALAVGVVAGLIFAASAVLFQKLAVATVGFLAGGLATLYVAASLSWDAGYWVLIAALAAGIVGALMARSLFELALVIFTSVAGAAFCVPAIEVGPELEMPLFLGLAAAGIVVQLALGRKRPKKT